VSFNHVGMASHDHACGRKVPRLAANTSGVSRKDFLRGLGAAGAGGLIVGGAGGYFGGKASSSS